MQALIDEGRLLRQSLEVMSTARDLDDVLDHRDSLSRRGRGLLSGGGKKSDLGN